MCLIGFLLLGRRKKGVEEESFFQHNNSMNVSLDGYRSKKQGKKDSH